MISYFRKKYALSEEGAKDLKNSVLWCTFANLSFMAPMFAAMIFLDFAVRSMRNGEKLNLNFGLYIALSAVVLLLMYVINYVQYGRTYTIIYDESSKRRINLAETLRKLPLAFFSKKDLADLTATVMEDATQSETMFSHAVPQMYAAFASLGIMAAMLFVYDFRLSVALFWVVPAALLTFSLSRKVQKRVQASLYSAKLDIADKIQEGLENAQEIKAYNAEQKYCGVLNTMLDNYRTKLMNIELLVAVLIGVSHAVLKLGLPTVLVYGAYLFKAGETDAFKYIVFLILSARIYDPVTEVINHLAALIHLEVRTDRMKSMDSMPRQNGRVDFKPQNYDVKFDNVSFSYEDNVQILDKVSFTAKQGEVTALVGPSGGGKSTAAKLAARLWDADSGKIMLGETDIATIDPETLLKSYSIIFQNVTLFNATILDNIKLGSINASDADAIEAAKLAQCDEFTSKLPKGYDTLIGENGALLSGGERQRISIARAILKDAPIILLDEATASLDAENESKVQRALSALIKEKTVIIIAHRMRTVLNADKIIVIDNGRIVQSGTPERLAREEGMFKEMLQKQQLGAIF
jgi:ATP-binding cassette subfamily B protein IrtB